jgi:predicted O-methyltransferase YrrM
MKEFFQNIILYLSEKKTFTYLLKHPLLALKNAKTTFLSQHNITSFIFNLLNVSERTIIELMPKGDSRRDLITASRASIAPSSGEYSVTFEEGLTIYLIVRILKPRYVVETGVAAGRSSAFILRGLYDNGEGELYSIDPDSNSGYAIPRHLKGRWKFINATSEEVLLGLLRKLKQIDIFLHDSLHTYKCMSFEYKSAWPFIKRGGILLSHDVSRNSAFQDFCRKIANDAVIVYLNKNFAGCRKC